MVLFCKHQQDRQGLCKPQPHTCGRPCFVPGRVFVFFPSVPVGVWGVASEDGLRGLDVAVWEMVYIPNV